MAAADQEKVARIRAAVATERAAGSHWLVVFRALRRSGDIERDDIEEAREFGIAWATPALARRKK